MSTARQLVGSFGVLLAIQALTSFVAIGLLGRMGPAIERMLDENVLSVRAVEEMLAVLAVPGAPDADAFETYADGLERVRNNLTEPEERAPLRRLEALLAAVRAGDAEARRVSVAALRDLGRINLQAMQRADEEAKFLGTAGAWAATFLGLLGLAVSLLSMDRARRRILAPMVELVQVVEAHAGGETHRRCTTSIAAVPEIARVTRELNRLYDAEERVTGRRADGGEERAVLVHLLDARSDAVAVVDSYGNLVVTNHAADELLAGSHGGALREALRKAPSGDPQPGIERTERLGDGGALLCVLAPGS